MKRLLAITCLLCLTLSGLRAQHDVEVSKYSLADTNKAIALSDRGWAHIRQLEFDSATFYISKALTIFSGIHHKRGIISCTNALGRISADKGDLRQALVYYHEALRLLDITDFPKYRSWVTTGIAMVYEHQGDYPKALQYYFTSLKIDEAVRHDSIAVAGDYLNISNACNGQKNYQQAIFYMQKAIAVFVARSDTAAYARSVGNLGLIYHDQGKEQSALECYARQLALARQIGDQESIANAYTNSGTIYMIRENWPQALESEQKALAMREEMQDKEGAIPCLLNIANILERQKKYREALGYVLKGNAMAAEIGSVLYLEGGEQVLASVYEDLGDYKQALAHYDRHVIIKDSLYNEEQIRQGLQTTLNYEFEKKEAAAKLEQEKREAVAEAVRKKQQVIIWALGGAAVLVLIISALLFRQARFRARQRTMQLEQQLLRSQMNPHFIFNSLTAIESFIYKNEPREAGRYLSGFARLMRLILENSRQEYVSLSSEVQALTNYLDLQKLRFAAAFDYTIALSPDIEPDLTLVPPMLAQPFIENAIEHGLRGAKEKGRIAIRFFLKGTDLVFEVQDNGMGFEAVAAQAARDKGHRSLATIITRERLENLNRKKKRITMVMEDVKDANGGIAGARVTFTIPFSTS